MEKEYIQNAYGTTQKTNHTYLIAEAKEKGSERERKEEKKIATAK